MKIVRKRVRKMVLLSVGTLLSVLLTAGCGTRQPPAADPAGTSKGADSGTYAVRTELKEVYSADPEKKIGVYGRYTELSADGEVPETLARVLGEANARAKGDIERKAAKFLAENEFPAAAEESAETEHFRYRNISHIVNVTRADDVILSLLETEMESGIGDAEGQYPYVSKTCVFRSAVYDTKSGRELALTDFLADAGSLTERLDGALSNKYGGSGLFTGREVPAWTADYLGLHFYFDGKMIPEEKMQALGIYTRRAVHVSIPYTALDGPLAETAAKTPESFIAAVEKNTDYALPHDNRTIRVSKALNSGYEQYRIEIRGGEKEAAWWLEYADDESEYYVFRAQEKYYFYRLEDNEDRGYVYSFASPDGGFERFANQNAQCFDSFLHELYLAVPSNPECVHMRERARKFMDSRSGLNTYYAPNGHYSFMPEPGRGRTWLHFALIDDALALDSRNVGLRLLHEISAVKLDEQGNAGDEITIPAGEVLRFLSVDGEDELYYYMSREYNSYKSGARNYYYDCELSDGSRVRIVTEYENSFFVDGMYMDRIGEPVTIGAAQYEAGLAEIPDHYVTIGGKEYKLIRDLSNKTESGEEIDFAGDVWWEVENYVGTFTAEEGDAKLVISGNGEVSFDYEGKIFKGQLPEKRYYNTYVRVYMEAEYERRTFSIIVRENLPAHDPSFTKIRFYSEGLPATNEPSHVPPITVDLVREP